MVFYTIWCATIQEKNFTIADRCPVYVLCEEGNFREYLRGDVVWVKKYFYVLRPVLAIQWLEANLGPVPTEFGILVDRVVERDDLKEAIRALIEQIRHEETPQAMPSLYSSKFLPSCLEIQAS